MIIFKNNLAIFFTTSFAFFAINCFSQTTIKKEITWEDKLYEKGVKYEEFACEIEDKVAVADFFKNHSLNRILGICHNNCAVLKAFSTRRLPFLSSKIKGDGEIGVHVLVNEEGRPIYARAVNGHPLMRFLLQKRVCESTFQTREDKRQNMIWICQEEKCDKTQPIQ